MKSIQKAISRAFHHAINVTKPLSLSPYPFEGTRGPVGLRCLVVVPCEKFGCLLIQDCIPAFDLMTYSYSGDAWTNANVYSTPIAVSHHLSFTSEFHGESLKYILSYVNTLDEYDLVLVLNGDIMISFSSINTCLFVAGAHGLDVFQPSLSLDSFYSHSFLLNKPGVFMESAPHTDMVALGISRRVANALLAENVFPISSWGIDSIVLPSILLRNKWKLPVVIHASIARHCKPVESSNTIFSNGKSARQELDEIAAIYS